MPQKIEYPTEQYTAIARQLYLQWFTATWTMAWLPYLTVAQAIADSQKKPDQKESAS